MAADLPASDLQGWEKKHLVSTAHLDNPWDYQRGNVGVGLQASDLLRTMHTSMALWAPQIYDKPPRGTAVLHLPCPPLHIPQELVQVPMLHVLEDHDEWITITTHTVELDNVLMLQVGKQLCLPLEILAGCQGGVFQCLKEGTCMYGMGRTRGGQNQRGVGIEEELMKAEEDRNHCHHPVASGELAAGTAGTTSAFCSYVYQPSGVSNSFPRKQQI